MRKHIQEATDVRIVDRGAKVIVIGDEADAAGMVGDLLTELLDAVRRGHTPTLDDVNYVLDEARVSRADSMGQVLGDTPAALRADVRIKPRTRGQSAYLDAIAQSDLTLAVGPAGTGKTHLAMAAAVSALLSKRVGRIILTRPAVEAGENLGFLPGDLQEKVNPYLRPLFDALYSMVSTERARRLIDRDTIEIAPLAFMRGRTLSNAFVILDEAQNTTREQMKMFLTRIGEGSKAVITGDITQVDLPRDRRSGLVDAMEILDGVEGVSTIKFSKRDVVRHPLVQRIVHAYDSADEKSEQES